MASYNVVIYCVVKMELGQHW